MLSFQGALTEYDVGVCDIQDTRWTAGNHPGKRPKPVNTPCSLLGSLVYPLVAQKEKIFGCQSEKLNS